MGLDFNDGTGQTPLNEEEKDGLRNDTIGTREELNEFEQKNIEEAVQWLMRKSLKKETILSEEFIRLVHKKMFSNVWQWAGQFRKTEKNLGIEPWKIAAALRVLCDDAKFWIEHDTYPPDDISIRFKHKLVSIHCFPNGNGRHSRLMADVIIEKIFKKPIFTWGAHQSIKNKEIRAAYLESVKDADRGNYISLIQFART